MKQQDLSQHELVAYLEQEVTPSEATLLEARLADSASARRRLQELRSIRDALCVPFPEVERIDLVPSIHQAIALPKPRHWLRDLLRGRTVWLSAGAAIAAATCFGLFSPRLRSPRPNGPAVGAHEFRARSAGSSQAEADRWVALLAYRKGEQGPPERLRDRLGTKDGMLFAYTNVGPRPFAYLMIFAISASGDVYWFYPEYREPANDPTSIRIREAQTNVELPDLIHQRLTAGRLSIYGLFTRTPLRVSQVEKAVAGRKDQRSRLSFPESAQEVLTVEVAP